MNTKVVIIVILSLALLGGLLYLFRNKEKKQSCKDYNYSQIQSPYTGRCLNVKEPPVEDKYYPAGVNYINRTDCKDDDDSQKWVVDNGKLLNLKTKQYLFSDVERPGWSALADTNNKTFNDPSKYDFSWNINTSKNDKYSGYYIENNMNKTLQDNPSWTQLQLLNRPIDMAQTYSEEIWNSVNPGKKCI